MGKLQILPGKSGSIQSRLHPEPVELRRHEILSVWPRTVGALVLISIGLLGSLALSVRMFATAPEPAWAGTVRPQILTASPSTVHPGDAVRIAGYNLELSSNYQIQVCGNGGFGGSTECNLASSTTAATGETGYFSIVLTVERPPVPCPCVVKAIPLRGSNTLAYNEVSTPITILGMPTAPVVPPSVTGTSSGLQVLEAHLVGTTSWSEWFGAPAHRTLVLVLRDGGPDPIPSTPVVIRSGQAGNPSQVVGAPFVPPLRPGQVVSYRISTTFPPLAHGQYVVVGTLGPSGQTVTFSTTTSLMPWGIIMVLAIIVLVAVVLIIRRILRRHRNRTHRQPELGQPQADSFESSADLGSTEEMTTELTMATSSSADQPTS